MAGENYGEKKNKIVFNMPSTAKLSSGNESIKDKELKDRLMKLIIDTHDEAIELKVNGDHYRKVGIHDEWRQVDFDNNKATYFSYQEKAAKDFIYRFNKCGILSDQVGMGKTIEAGMIITELAYRKELGSLLILVPNENMSEKWEVELARKFGFRNYYKDLDVVEGKEEYRISYDDLPKVASIKSLTDVYSIIFDAYDAIHNSENTLNERIRKEALRIYDEILNKNQLIKIRKIITEILEKNKLISSKEFKMMVLQQIYAPLVYDFVKTICDNMGYSKIFEDENYQMDLGGIYYHIVDMSLDTQISDSVLVNGILNRIIDKELITNSIVREFNFVKYPLGLKVINDINETSAKAINNDDRVKYVQEFKNIAAKIKQQYAILIVSKIIGEGEQQQNLLNLCLNKDFESESNRHCYEDSVDEKGYFLIDLLIDMSYKTLIVDEAHDYIKVSHKQHMREDIAAKTDYVERQRKGIEFSDLDLREVSNTNGYFVFPLYNDYYFVKKDCLYLKVKALAERSFRKIFMTATPIKSDMIDFYLLYLLADNSDVNTYNRIRRILNSNNVDIAKLCGLIMGAMSSAQKRSMNYVTHEDLVMKYIYKFYYNNQDKMSGNFEQKIQAIIQNLYKNQEIDLETIQQICVNEVRKQFQETFTIRNEKTNKDEEITSISDLVSSDEGIEHWQNMYSQIGIRSTRHQTFRLDEEHLQLVNKVQRDKYRNLPVWSRRNGTIFYINKRDNFFDLIVKEKLEEKKQLRQSQVDDGPAELRRKTIDEPMAIEIAKYENDYNKKIEKIENEDNSDVIRNNLIAKETALFEKNKQKVETKYKPKETALEIYNYINDQLTGTLNESYYYSTDVDYDEFKLHLVAALMTDGVLVEGQEQRKKISGKVLLFTDESTQQKVLNWLRDDATPKTVSQEKIEEYRTKYKHDPIWYYNNKHVVDDQWVITTDIKSLKEKKGNYLIVVEPNKYEEGVDLQSSNTLINFDIKFCPLKMEQRIGRIDRVKLCDEQPQLDIISFTPLNDMSGFMVDFLANELKMFSCWKGDTTGIVSMPLGEKPNSATFEDAILDINDAYKNLYTYNGKEFLAALKKLGTLGEKFTDQRFIDFCEFIKNEDRILKDLEYLKESSSFINKIVYNTSCSNNDGAQDVVFGLLKIISEQRAYDEGEIAKDSFTEHVNDLRELKSGIESYYNYNIQELDNQIKTIAKASKANPGGIDTVHNNDISRLKTLTRRLNDMKANKQACMSSTLYTLKSNSSIKKEELDLILEPIVGQFKKTVYYYLDQLLNLFDYFCDNVQDRSKKMTRFISYLTVEEFRVMAGNYE